MEPPPAGGVTLDASGPAGRSRNVDPLVCGHLSFFLSASPQANPWKKWWGPGLTQPLRPGLVLEKFGRAADHAAQRVIHDKGGDARGHLYPAGQSEQQRPAAGEADLAADHVLGEVWGKAEQDRPYRVDDGGDDALKRG